MPMTKFELLQWVFQLSVDYLIWEFISWKALMYLLISTVLGSSFHPLAGHFVAEHYEWAKGFETYSYYGPLNLLTYNVGYHNEHHDFPRIPGSRLPQLKKMAPEFYDHLPSHSSWVAVMWRFIWDPTITPFARTVRDTLTKGKRDANGKPLTD
jgi:sphingolipid delta-4 desaturase